VGSYGPKASYIRWGADHIGSNNFEGGKGQPIVMYRALFSELCCGKTAELIEMPFGFRTRVVPMNDVLDGGSDPPWEGAILQGKKGRRVVKCSDSAVSCAKMAEPTEMLFGIWTGVGSRKHVLGGVHTGAT